MKHAPPLRVLVVQMGARRGYELARMLEQRGALAALQTSAAWHEGQTTTRLLGGLYPAKRGALARRTVCGLPPHKVRTTFVPELVGVGLDALGVETERRYRIEDWFLGASARRRGLAGANVVLTTSGNGGNGFLRWAKAQGTKIASDIVITPLCHEIVAQEVARWPEWAPARDMSGTIAIYRQHIEELVAASDLLLCPSDTVIEGLSTVRGFDTQKVACVPYSLGSAGIRLGQPIPKRVLFAGEASLRKGVPYLAEAASRLRARDPGFDFRVAGKASYAVRARPECADLNFLGHLSPDRMDEEFRFADIFCLPSLAEGMASVTIEALAGGLPCVVTRAAGSLVENGVEGLVVPERDGAALAEAIAGIAGNRAMRDRMSAAAIRRAGEQHSLDAVGDRLYGTLLNLVAPGVSAF